MTPGAVAEQSRQAAAAGTKYIVQAHVPTLSVQEDHLNSGCRDYYKVPGSHKSMLTVLHLPFPGSFRASISVYPILGSDQFPQKTRPLPVPWDSGMSLRLESPPPPLAPNCKCSLPSWSVQLYNTRLPQDGQPHLVPRQCPRYQLQQQCCSVAKSRRLLPGLSRSARERGLLRQHHPASRSAPDASTHFSSHSNFSSHDGSMRGRSPPQPLQQAGTTAGPRSATRRAPPT